jgi:hypothetical protein
MRSILKVITRSGFCLDYPGFLKFYLAALDTPALRQAVIALRIKFSPDILDRVRNCELPTGERAVLFSRAMTIFRSGTAYKTTAMNRSPMADRAVLEKTRPGDLIVETGVSDGISALNLLENAGAARVMLTDSQERFLYRDTFFGRIFHDGGDGCAYVKTLFFYLCTGVTTGKESPHGGSVSLLNPLIADKFGAELVRFDIFTGTLPRPADIIKCSNVLNTVYFSPEEIKRGFANLSRNLKDGGWLIVSRNNKTYAAGEACLSLQKRGQLLALREQVNGYKMLPFLNSALFSDLISA